MKSKKNMSSSTLVTIMILSFLFFTNIGVKAQSYSCSHKFAKLMEKRNITKCKPLRTLGAEFAWNYHNGTNSTTILEILFGANIGQGDGWIGWGVNPGNRAEMIGTKAIIGIRYHGTYLPVGTYDVTKGTKRGCSLLPTDIGLNVSDMSIQHDQGSNFYTIYARLVLPSDKYNITRLNHVWQVGNNVRGQRPLGHPTTLHNVDSTETIDLTSPDGRSRGQKLSFLRSVTILFLLCYYVDYSIMVLNCGLGVIVLIQQIFFTPSIKIPSRDHKIA